MTDNIIHIPFHLLGVMANLKDYKEGDPIMYGTTLYYPVSGTNLIKDENGNQGVLTKTPKGWSCWIS